MDPQATPRTSPGGILLPPGVSDLELPDHAEADLVLPEAARRQREVEHKAAPALDLRPCPNPFGVCVWLRTMKKGKRQGVWACIYCRRPR